LRLLAAYAGIAIRNASLYQAERAQAGRLAALAAINQRISGSLDLDDLLRRIAESAASLAGVKYASFWLADEERQSLTMKWGSVPGLAEDFPQRVVDYDFGGAGWIARHRRPLVADNVFDDPRIVYYDWWRRWGISAYAGYPVLAGDELQAVLVLTHTEPIRFSPETQGLIDMFIAQASVAIQNARLYHDAQHRREVAEALARVGREVTASLDVEHIAEQVARGVVALLDGRGAAVWRYEPADDALHAVGTSGPDVAKGDVLRSGEGLVGRAIVDRRVVTTRDIFSEPGVTLSDPLRRQLLESGHRAIIAVPLMVQDRIVGALGMTGDQGRLFPREEVTVLEAFADQAALALENARLYASAQDSLARLRDTQAQLVQVAKMSALGQLVSGVAHELNNPLSVIIGYGQLLLHREVPETLRRPLELIVAQGDRMAKIVRNLLYFARQRPPERAPVDLHQVIEQTLALRLNQLALSGIAVEKDFAPDLPRVSADAQQLQQVFLNLLLNAEQAIGGGGRGGRIALRTGVLDGGRAVRAQVIDDGPGVSPEALPRVFEPFFTTKEVGVGTGLGLSVSYGIVEEHGGRLTVASAPGETVFTLELPVGAPAGSPAPPGAAAAAPFAAAGRAALVVEDEPGVADLVASLLRDTGWRVDVAPGGRAGLARVRERRYDLIVSDIRMPDGSGEDFYREAVQGDPALGGRFLIITGDTANARALEFVKRQKLPVLEKPFAPDRFLEAVRRVASSLTASGSSA
ncbi:MAG: GAF domain-containing protein, partial [Candidatus Rokubacteria bacterium]|nr:GAF domain-containing protein [Candidatus Rokubacteria bacterium]